MRTTTYTCDICHREIHFGLKDKHIHVSLGIGESVLGRQGFDFHQRCIDAEFDRWRRGDPYQ